MKRKYQGSSKVKHAQLQDLRYELKALVMKEGESVNDFFEETYGSGDSIYREQ
jgi:hypothetical protein